MLILCMQYKLFGGVVQNLGKPAYIILARSLRFYPLSGPNLLLKLYELSKVIMSCTLSKFDLKWLLYGKNRNIIATHSIFGRLADR